MKTMKTARAILAAVLAVSVVPAGTPVAALAQVVIPPPPQQAAIAPGSDAQDRGWPRRFEAEGHEVIVYAPQVDEWPKFGRITFRAAISVAPVGSETREFGIIRISADTDVLFEDRLVVLSNRKLEELTFPDVDASEANRLKGIVVVAMPPQRPQTVSLDRIVAAMTPAEVDVRKVEVNTAPPKVFTSTKRAVLVIFMGKPRFKPVPDSDLLYAINTNWDVFLDPTGKKYYMLDDKSWLVTADIDNGPWAAATSLPASLAKLPPDENWKDVTAAVPGVRATDVPAVYVSQEPAELIVTQGDPELEMIPGTRLMVVANTESNVFYDTADKQFYFLAAGRWFKSPQIAGPWAAASGSLPADFKKIPATPEYADVLAAVPGTVAANSAVILASIPQKATINRTEVTVKVTYDGAPVFKPIETTTVQYAYNTPYSVFLVGGRYYCCYNAVWFESPTPSGGWVVCVSVPKAIYTIPPTSPMYNVTYVVVYQSTPTTVVTGYTAGYSGATVAATGVVMFGLGMVVGAALNDNSSSYHYHSSYYSYGCGARWHGGYGGYVCGGAKHYGPYGGAGHAAAYNPATGVYSRAGYAYGPRGAAGYRTAYNPATGNSAARAGGVSPYGSWGASAVSNGNKWATASHQTTARGTTARMQTSSGAAAATAQGRYGNGATVAKDKSGDYYASKNGNVYKNSGDGWQQTRNNGSGSSGPQPRTTSSQTASQTSRSTSAELQQQASARSYGDQSAARASQYQSSGGASTTNTGRGGGGSRGGGSGGGGGRRR